MNSRKNAARTERLQKKLEAGSVSEHYPEVASIVISMMYKQKGVAKSLPRTVNFFPGSSALFRVDCLSRDCVDGGFDLTHVITSLIRDRGTTAKGTLDCEGDNPPVSHSSVVYEVAIQYA